MKLIGDDFICRNLFIATNAISTIRTKMMMRRLAVMAAMAAMTAVMAGRNKKARIQSPFLRREKTLPPSIRLEKFQN